jgi:hypothetical protein
MKALVWHRKNDIRCEAILRSSMRATRTPSWDASATVRETRAFVPAKLNVLLS